MKYAHIYLRARIHTYTHTYTHTHTRTRGTRRDATRRSTPGRRERARRSPLPASDSIPTTPSLRGRLIPAVPAAPLSRRPTIALHGRLESVAAAATTAALYGVREARREET